MEHDIFDFPNTLNLCIKPGHQMFLTQQKEQQLGKKIVIKAAEKNTEGDFVWKTLQRVKAASALLNDEPKQTLRYLDSNFSVPAVSKFMQGESMIKLESMELCPTYPAVSPSNKVMTNEKNLKRK
jgi:hypothetical protein